MVSFGSVIPKEISGDGRHALAVWHKVEAHFVNAAKVAQGINVFRLVGHSFSGMAEQMVSGVNNFQRLHVLVCWFARRLQLRFDIAFQGVDEIFDVFSHVSKITYFFPIS